MIRRPPRSTLDRSSAASDVYKRQELGVREGANVMPGTMLARINSLATVWIYAEVPETISANVRLGMRVKSHVAGLPLSLIHISEPTRPY